MQKDGHPTHLDVFSLYSAICGNLLIGFRCILVEMSVFGSDLLGFGIICISLCTDKVSLMLAFWDCFVGFSFKRLILGNLSLILWFWLLVDKKLHHIFIITFSPQNHKSRLFSRITACQLHKQIGPLSDLIAP